MGILVKASVVQEDFESRFDLAVVRDGPIGRHNDRFGKIDELGVQKQTISPHPMRMNDNEEMWS